MLNLMFEALEVIFSPMSPERNTTGCQKKESFTIQKYIFAMQSHMQIIPASIVAKI